MHINIKNFKKYEDYLNLQKEKTEDPVRRERWIREQKQQAKLFEDTFKPYLSKFNLEGKGICLAARTGEECVALQDLGMKNCKGMDLVPFGDLVEEGDIHNLSYLDDSFDFVYSNSIDHVLYPEKFISECFRVLRKDGILFFQLQLHTTLDKYGVLDLQSPDELLHLCFFYNYKLLVSEPPAAICANNHFINWNVIMKVI